MSQDNDLVALATAIGHPDAQLATDLAAGLRLLATMIEENPEIADSFESTFRHGIAAHPRGTDAGASMAQIGRIARAYGATTTKDITESMHNLVCDFGRIKVKVLAMREEVCERVVVGTETVTKTVKDPEKLAEVPEVEVTETVEVVEWQCKPLLAAEPVNA